jgi:flavoprotein
MEKIPIYESKKSDKIIKFIDLSVEKLSDHCSVKYAKKIVRAHENGYLWGVHITKMGTYRAIFI